MLLLLSTATLQQTGWWYPPKIFPFPQNRPKKIWLRPSATSESEIKGPSRQWNFDLEKTGE